MSNTRIALNIRDATVCGLARQLANNLGVSETAAVRFALSETLGRMKSPSDNAMRLEQLQEFAQRSAEWPVLDSRTADEILGYDEIGLPT